MILTNRSSLSISSETRTVAEISGVLGIAPHDSADIGEPTRAALSGRTLTARHMLHHRTYWSFDADTSLVDPADDTGFSSLRLLAGVFRGKASALRSLRPECETVIWWSGDSDNSQGTFVIPVDLLGVLAVLGCELRGTTFLSDDQAE